MFVLLHWATAFVRRLTTGPPLTGVRLVVPVPFAGPRTVVEVGLQDGWIAVRLVRASVHSTALWDGPDADLGPHDFFGRY
jgi:hypothetical protein